MKEHYSIIERDSLTLEVLNSSIKKLIKDSPNETQILAMVERGYLSPSENETLAYWFARFISLRSNLWLIVDTALLNTGGMDRLNEKQDWQYFVLAYSAVCHLRHLDRFLLSKIAKEKIIQRKLNEAFPEHRIERKQFSSIYTEMMHPRNAWHILEAHKLLQQNATQIEASVSDSPVQAIFHGLSKQERYIDFSKRYYFWAWLKNRLHSLKRRGASAKQKSIFTTLEYGGRIASELALPRTKKVTSEVLSEIEQLLEPGDIFITRHRQALTNLFLPGFWPHAALYIGSEIDRSILKIKPEAKHLEYWNGNKTTFEALKDGVRFRSLKETLAVDALVVVRPNLSQQQIASAIERVIVHAGKAYNFDFDFFRSDCLVCTEVIYRAYDGINNFSFPLREQMGRKALAAEDILDLALDSTWAKPIAIFGVGENKSHLITEQNMIERALVASYRN